MALKREELELIGEYVQSHLTEWLPERVFSPPEFSLPLELTERMIRVEEELKNQRELMKLGFEQTDKRFEEMQHNMDKRFELMQHNMDKRFEQIDKRFDQVDNNFKSVNESIKSLETKMFQFMVWSFGFTVTVAGVIIAVIKFV